MKIVPPSNPCILAVYLLLGALAFGLRLYLAGIAYPAQGDVPAIIAQGVTWAHGEGMVGFYPEIPALIAGIAYRSGLDPAEALQTSNVMYGTIVVIMTMLLAWRFFERHVIAWIAGGLAATNNSMLTFSTNSMPEGGFSACLLCACAWLARTLAGGPISLVPTCGAFSLLALGIYFRPIESLLALSTFSGWLIVIHWSDMKKLLRALVPALVCAVCVVTPYYMRAQSDKGGEDRVSANVKTLALGDYAYDGKVIHDPSMNEWKEEITGEVMELGVLRWLWKHKEDVGRRYVRNLMRSIRYYSDYLFSNAFRLGTGWFLLLGVSMIWCAAMGSYKKENLFLFLTLISLPAGLSLGYVFSRYLVQYLPLLIILFAAFMTANSAFWTSRARQVFISILVLAMMANAGAVTIRGHRDQVWSWDNLREVARVLREIVPEQGKIITPQDPFMIEFDLDQPKRWKKYPFATPEQFEAYAARRQVTHVVLCSTQKSQYPIHGLFNGIPPPDNWALVFDKTFRRDHPVWGPQEETYRIYERIERDGPK